MATFAPSKYQQKFFDELVNTDHNIVIEACAGSGKTTTIVQSIGMVGSDKKILVIAFNKSIADELSSRLESHKNVRVKTLHGFGYGLLLGYMRGVKPQLDEYKYKTYVRESLHRLLNRKMYDKLGNEDKETLIANIVDCVNLARVYLCKNEGDVYNVLTKYELPLSPDYLKTVLLVMNWGKTNLDTIDYTDMVWLPNALGIQNTRQRYDYVFIDECQDLNRAQHGLFMSALKPSVGRFVAVGDRKQCIYTFAGGDEESFERIMKYENTVTLPLSITYRCAKEIVDVARGIVPTIEANPSNTTVGKIEQGVTFDEIADDSMVLCRAKNPLAKLYTYLLKRNKKCYIKGKEIGASMIGSLVKCDHDYLHQDLSQKGVFYDLYCKLFSTIKEMSTARGMTIDRVVESATVQNMIDEIETLNIIAEGVNKKDELIRKINSIFLENGEGIMLSTIHKAKGLEAERVYILGKSLLGGSNRALDWQIKEETCLEYVAYTRAKSYLGFLAESENKKANDDMSIFLKAVEKKILKLDNGLSPIDWNNDSSQQERIKRLDSKMEDGVFPSFGKTLYEKVNAKRSHVNEVESFWNL